MLLEYLDKLTQNKKVLILGFGREGKATYRLLKKIGTFKSIGIADMNEVTDVEERVFWGADYQKAINDYDLVFKSPGVVLENFSQKHKITSQTDVIINCFGRSMIGITGTKGKSTTTSIIYHVLSECKKNAVLMGNIGIPAFDAAENITDDALIVYELSCHQLEFAEKSPHRSVMLNIYPEHLDHYGTFEKYEAAKRNIYKNMQTDDLLVCGHEFAPDEHNFRLVTVSMTENTGDYWAQDESFTDGKTSFNPVCSLFGIHNMYNISAAYAICKDCGVDEKSFFDALTTYKPLPHRLELFAEINGVRYFDDSISTIPETAIKAISSIKNVGTVILGGMDRGIELDSLCDFLKKNPIENVILMPDTGKLIYEKLNGSYEQNLYLTSSLEEAASLAKSVTKSGFACVLSPAAASYGFFKNFEHRGYCFKKAILGE